MLRLVLCFLAGCSFAVLALLILLPHEQPAPVVAPPPVQGPFRPRPRPEPEPPLAPLEDTDRRLFDRLRPHLEELAERRATAKITDALNSTAAEIAATDVDPGGRVTFNGEPVEGFGAAMIGAAIVALVKRVIHAIVAGIVAALLLGAIVALLQQWWMVIVPVFMLAVTVVAYPIAWASALWHRPKIVAAAVPNGTPGKDWPK